MTYAEMQARVEALCRLEGWSDVPTPPDWGSLVNRALCQFSTVGEYIQDEFSFATVANTSEYSLLDTDTRDWVGITTVLYGTGNSKLERSNPHEQAKWSTSWFRDSAGTPGYWWLSEPNKMRLHPIPAGVATVYVLGTRAEAELTSPTASPSAFATFHEDVCRLAASLHGEEYATTELQLTKVARWQQQASVAAERCRTMLYGERIGTWQRDVQCAPRRLVRL